VYVVLSSSSPRPRSSTGASIDSDQSAVSPFAIMYFEVEIASEPTTSATRNEPAATRSQNSLTSVCGVSPPTLAHTAVRGVAPRRRAIECGKLSDLPNGVE
jgi:hypothetical protein